MQRTHVLALARRARDHARSVAGGVLNHNGERRTVTRWYAFGALRRLTPSVAVVHDGLWYYVSTKDDLIGRHTFSTGSYEQDLLARALEIIESLTGAPAVRGRIFVDVGANIGTTSVPVATLFGASEVLAFEPYEPNFRLLRCNLIANNLENSVRAYPLALSDRSGTALLELSEANWGDHRVRVGEGSAEPGVHGEAGRGTVEVGVARLDEVLAVDGVDLEKLGVLWMDTQGHEGHVLAGARSVMAAGVPIVLEYWPYALSRAGGLALLHQLIAENYGRVVDLRASVRSGRIVEVRSEQLPQLENQYRGDVYTDLVVLR